MNIAVIGGGASGMMSAVWSAYNGANVTLYESNDKLGKKIYITGKGRCNVTNLCDKNVFVGNVVTNGKFLMSAISQWGPQDTVDFLEQWGLQCKVERGNRVFPISDKASDVTKTLDKAMHNLGVKYRLSTKVKAIQCQKSGVFVHTITDIVSYDAVIVACGGLSYSSTGSTGDGYRFAQSIGHKIVPTRSALCEVYLKENVAQLNGVSLKNVRLSAYYQGRQIFSQLGEMLFTYKGISGPLVLSLSSYINRLPLDKVTIELDLKTGLPYKANTQGSLCIESRLHKDFEALHNKSYKNSLNGLLPQSVASYVVARTGIDGDTKVNSLTVSNRSTIIDSIKKLTFGVARLADIEQSIVTSGGVSISEINPSTMQSKLCSRVFFVGECLDVDALTGGYNLQIAFSTGYLAGNSVMSILYQLEDKE